MYATAGSRDPIRELGFGGVTDEKFLAQLQKGVGWLIDMVITHQDLVRADMDTVKSWPLTYRLSGTEPSSAST